uniref:Uncharacterized protein n=1 Tax=Rhizophora mucronata TaxID=61149 RepID=A0A2P2PPU8_RHIMU
MSSPPPPICYFIAFRMSYLICRKMTIFPCLFLNIIFCLT